MVGLRLSDEVAQAVRDGAPVVALESTISSHGLPRPGNVDVAREIQQWLDLFQTLGRTENPRDCARLLRLECQTTTE